MYIRTRMLCSCFPIFHCCVQVEVPSQSLDDGERDEGGEGLEDEEVQFHVEMEGTRDAPLIRDTLTAIFSRRPVMTSDMAEKLDIMMSICFEHFYSLCHSNGKKQNFKHWGGGGVWVYCQFHGFHYLIHA